MLYLALSLLFSTSIFVIFRLFGTFKVPNFEAIIINYFVAFLTGMFFADYTYNFQGFFEQKWLPFALLIGVLFISLFNVMALTAQKSGISVASVANKLSVVIPVSAAYFLYQDEFNFTKIAGIVFALIGVVGVSKKAEKIKLNGALFWLPFILFVGSGFLDTVIKYTEHHYLTQGQELSFIPTLFVIAGIIGLLYKLVKEQSIRFSRKAVLWGIILGVPNYFSIYFLIKTLKLPGFESSAIFPINNIGIVCLSAFVSFIFFKERFSKVNWFGLASAVLGITLIALSR